MADAADELPLTRAMWAASEAAVTASAEHEFLLAMLSGELAPRCFQYYVRQDRLYLLDFALALRRLAALSEGEDVEALRAFADGADVAEASLHESFFAAWGVDATALLQDDQAPTTLAYTSFLLRCVADGRAEGLAALLPCFWVWFRARPFRVSPPRRCARRGDAARRAHCGDAARCARRGDAARCARRGDAARRAATPRGVLAAATSRGALAAATPRGVIAGETQRGSRTIRGGPRRWRRSSDAR